MTLDRRNFIKLVGGAGSLALAGCASQGPAVSSGSAAEIMPKGAARRVVVVGGGYGGTIAAKYIRMMDPSIEVVLVERNDHFVSCPFSNLYIGGILPDLSSLTIKYDKLIANHGIKFVQAEVTAIDPAAHTVVTSKGTLKYDRLVISPGIDFRTEEIEGYNAQTPEIMPHAWKAGPQTVLLRKQLEAMKDGGTVVLAVPLSPFRCPPGPYERTSMIARYLKKHKPKSKIIVVDANPDIASKGPLFRKGWDMHYKGIIDYLKASKVTAINAANKSVLIEGLDEVKGDVINLIPPQRAANIAVQAGLVGDDKKWCPVNQATFESTLHEDIHVIGDASIAGAMPKSGYSANSEAKICAANVVALMNGKPVVPLSGINTCYSYITDDEAISVAAVYMLKDGKIVSVPNSGGVSPKDWSMVKTEAIYAKSWLRNILTEMST
ncbi:NAD(P)/FAD-dependent oxidoreductase [Sulfuricystis multivorans]|uniref:NAD(P)/FAD-dependent oxidoreductase n=1 Tax=Sulfuricystis multivorans TaxID=2211108 RepID=UPI000F81D841|nr:FAD/NAD(P)-binding oxidoreductase [Sulfuricystis multivorans]